MDNNKYEIQLGVSLDTKGLKQQINQINNGKHKIDLGVDLKVNDIRDRIKAYNNNANNAKVKLGVKLDTSDIKQQIKNLNLSGLSKSQGMNVAVNTESLEKSLNEVKDVIADIRTALGSLSGDGMKDIVSSINQMATALGKAENESDSLVKSLSALSKKDFSFNIGLDLGKKGSNNMIAYGRTARRQIIPELESQIKELENMLGGTGKAFGKASKHLDVYEYGANMGSDAIIQRMEAMEDYIVAMKKVASAEGVNLDGFDKIHRNVTELINDVTGVESAVNKAGDVPEKLKNIFGGSVDGDNLSKQLDSVVADLGEIRTAIQSLSSGASLDGLIQSFNRLSDVLDKLDANFDRIKNNFGSGFVDSGVVQSAQQVGQKLGESIEQSVEQSLKLDDVVDDQTNAIQSAQQIGKKIGESLTDSIKDSIKANKAEIEKVVSDLNKNALGDLSEIFNLKRIDVDSSVPKEVNRLTKELNGLAEQAVRVGSEETWVNILDKMRELDSLLTTNGRVKNESNTEELYKNTLDYFNGKKISIPENNIKEVISSLDTSDIDILLKKGSIENLRDLNNQLINLGVSFSKGKNTLNKDWDETIEALGRPDLANVINDVDQYTSLINELLIVRDSLYGKMSMRDVNSEEVQDALFSWYDGVGVSSEKVNVLYEEQRQLQSQLAQQIQQSASTITQSQQQSANTAVQSQQQIQQAYQNTGDILNSFRKSLQNIGMGSDEIDAVANRIANLGVQIETLNQKKSTRKIKTEDGVIEKEVLSVDISGVDEYGNAIKLTQQYDMATAELIKSIDKVSTVQQKAGTSTDKFVKQQKMAVSNLSNQAKQLHSSAIDQNASRPIKETAHLDALKSKYKEIEDAIEVMGNASNEAFTEEQVKVKDLIADYKIMKNEFKNAENVSSSLKGTDFKSGLEIAKNDLEKFKANASDFPQITKTIEELDKAIANVGDKSSLDSFTDQLKVARAELAKVKAETIATNRKEKVGINVSGVTSQIANIQRISPEINEFKTVIDGAEVSVESLLNDLSRVNTAGDFSVVKARFKAFEDAAESAGIAITEVVTKASTIDKIKFKISDTGFNGFKQEVKRAHTETEKLELASDSLIKALKELDIAMENVYSADASGDTQALVNANKEYEASLKRVTSLLKLNQQAEKDAYNAEMLDQRRTALSSDMEIWLKENTRATRDFGEEIRKLQGSLNSLDDRGLKLASKQFTSLKKQAQAMGKTGLTVFGQLKAKAAQYFSYLSAAEIFMYAEQAFRSMFEQVKLIDSAMTELKKVTDETEASYEQFLTNAASRAKEIGTTIDGLVSSTADFARLGYGFEDAQGLAEVANIYAVVGDEIEGIDGATENLISTLAAFKDEMNGMSNTDFAMSIIDSLNEIGNNYAISSGGLGEALKRSASSLAAANNTLHESAALITAANEVAQNPEKVGNAMKTVSMRIRGAKTQLEEMGEDTEGMAESTATMRQEMIALAGVDIMASATEFKSTYQILDELSQKWGDLSDIAQATIIELMAGKHQGNVFSSLMENFGTARDVLETSLNSSGSAMQEHEKWSQSLEAQLNKLKAAWQGLSQAFLNSDFLKKALDIIIDFTTNLTKLIDKFGTFGTIGLGASIVGVFKNFKILKDIGSNAFTVLTTNAMESVESFDKWSKASNGVVSGGKKLITSLSGVVGAIGAVISIAGLAYNAYKNYKEEQSQLRQETIETSDTFLDAANSFEQAYIKYSGRTDLTTEEESELETAIQGTVDALGDKSSALQSVVNSSNDYLSALERITDAELKESNRTAKAKREAAKEELKEIAIGDAKWDGSEINIAYDGRLIDDSTKDAFDIAKKLDVNSKYYSEYKSGVINPVTHSQITLSGEANTEEIVEYYNFLQKYQEELSDANLDNTDVYKNVTSIIDKLTDSINVYVSSVYEASKAQYQLANGIPKTTEEYIKMRESILKSEDISGLDINEKMNILNSLDSEYKQTFDLSAVETQARKFVGIIKGYGNGTKDGTDEIGTVETFLNMRTAVNNNECTVSEYLSELDNVTSMAEMFSSEEKEQFNLVFGIDSDAIKEQYDELKTKLTDEYYGIEMSDNYAKTFLDNLNLKELTATRDLFSSHNDDFKNILRNYSDILDEAKQESVDFSKTVYGNIDTNARQVLEWNGKNLEKYKDQLMSFEPEGTKWGDVKKEYENSISTIIGMWDTFEIDGKKVDIAFSPMLQTDNGAELLSSGTVNSYIQEIIGKATEDGKWSNKELLKLDAEGIEVDGKKIKGLLADIGDTAEETSMQMHFVGKDGALALAESEIFAIVEKQAKLNEALNYTIAVDVETEGLTAFNTAMTESVTGAGLSSASIDTLKSRYKELEAEGYNLSAMFEETSNGIHLNREAVSELEQAYAQQKLSETDGQLKVLKGRYDELSTEINNCTDASERASLYTEQQSIIDKINDLGTLAAQYEGLTSAYNQWQNAEAAGQERDMYEGVIEGFENIKDEISRGWIDDGTTEFLELLTGKTDLASKSGKELKKIYDDLDNTIKNTTYSVRDFFTVDEDGNSTNTGVYNFLDAIGQLEEEKFGGKDVVKRDKSGNIIGFDFELVAKKDKKGNVVKNGDQVIAETLGISEELVQIMVRASDDAGFVINLEGAYTQLADLKTEAESARDTLISLQKKGLKQLKGVDVNFDLNAEGNDLVKEQKEAVNLLDKFKKDGKIDLKMEGAQQALDIAEYLTIKLDDLTEPKIMQIDVSEVDEDLRDPIEKMQEIVELSKEKNLVSLTGDKKEIKETQSEINKVAKELEELDPEIKAKVGIDEDWDAKTIASKVEKGEIEIPAELELDVQMSDDLKDMRLMMMNQLGLASDNEVKLKVGFDIDESLVDTLDDKQQKVVVEYITKNKKEFDKLTEEEKEVVVDLVANGVALEKYEVEDKEAIVNYIANGEEADGWTPEAKDAFVKYLADGGEIDKFDPKDKESWVVYKKDSSIPDNYDPEDPDATVTYDKDSKIPDGYDPDKDGLVTFKKDSSAIDKWKPTVTGIAKFTLSMIIPQAVRNALAAVGISIANGTANVDGTAFADGSATELKLSGKAYKQGDWGVKQDTTALTGELGQELVVYGNRFWTVGDTGAEFSHIPRGAIVFNHKICGVV